MCYELANGYNDELSKLSLTKWKARYRTFINRNGGDKGKVHSALSVSTKDCKGKKNPEEPRRTPKNPRMPKKKSRVSPTMMVILKMVWLMTIKLDGRDGQQDPERREMKISKIPILVGRRFQGERAPILFLGNGLCGYLKVHDFVNENINYIFIL